LPKNGVCQLGNNGDDMFGTGVIGGGFLLATDREEKRRQKKQGTRECFFHKSEGNFLWAFHLK
jgi:hypothetical protein